MIVAATENITIEVSKNTTLILSELSQSTKIPISELISSIFDYGVNETLYKIAHLITKEEIKNEPESN